MIYSLIVTSVGVLIASLLRGFTGFGFGLAAVPILSLALPPTQVVPFVVALQVTIGIMGVRKAVGQCDWRSVGMLTPGLLTGIPLGLAILTTLPANPVRLVIGCMIALSVWLLTRGIRLPPSPSWPVSFGTGLASGVTSGLASMGGPPVIVYFLAVGHTTARMRATSIVYFLFTGLVSFIMMGFRGLITREILTWTLAAVPIMATGSYAGTWLFHRAKPRHHRLVALGTLSVLSALLIIRAIVGMRS